MKASHLIDLVLLNAFSTLFRQVGAKQSANWAIDSETCYRQNFAPLDVARAINISKHVVDDLASDI